MITTLELVPLYIAIDKVYGDPRGYAGDVSESWFHDNVKSVIAPFSMRLSWDRGIRIERFKVHFKVAEATLDALEEIKKYRGESYLESRGYNIFGGCFQFRLMKGSESRLSVHAYAAAIDINPHLAPYRVRSPQRVNAWMNDQPAFIRKAFTSRGFRTFEDDGMHFQAVD